MGNYSDNLEGTSTSSNEPENDNFSENLIFKEDYTNSNNTLFYPEIENEIIDNKNEKTKTNEGTNKLDNSHNFKNDIFLISKKKKRGKQNSKRKIPHSRNSLDNLLSKIQIHFFSFIINVSNDALFNEFHDRKKYNFKEIDYKIKKLFNIALFEKYKNKNIEEILKFDISRKFKNFQKDNNKSTIEKVLKLSFYWLKKFFNLNYLEFFHILYFKEKPSDKIIFEGREIQLSKRTKNFSYLIKKNEGDKLKLIDAVENFYGHNKLFQCKQFN